MREIKFRAWNKKINLMTNVNRIFFNEDCVEVQENHDDFDNSFWFFDDIELMQYTGLKDKNGNDVYEGDICKFDWIGWGQKKDIVSEIYWDKQELCFTLGNIVRSGFEYIENLLVLGNIYENPILLEKEIDDAIVNAQNKLNKILKDK